MLLRAYPQLHPDIGDTVGGTRAVLRKAVEAAGLRLQKTACDQKESRLQAEHFRTAAVEATVKAVLSDLVAGRDVLLIGERGSGKSALGRYLRESSWRLFAVHRDMTSRDLLQRRATEKGSGASTWVDQPCVSAARAGGVVVLD